MAKADASIEVDVPVRTAYNEWTQFERFPEYLSGVKRVQQLNDTTLHWVVNPGGVEREFDAVITEQVPDRVIAWVSTGELQHAGTVRFTPVEEGRTQVDVSFQWEPEGFLETVGSVAMLDSAFAQVDLQNFKEHIETERAPSGAWRGEVRQGEIVEEG